MDLSDLIRHHAKELAATAREAAQEKRSEADLARPANLYRARIERVDARRNRRERQRAETEKRLVAAIEAQKRLRKALEKEARSWEERAPQRPDPSPAPGPRPTRQSSATTEKPAKAKRATAARTTKAATPKAPRSGKST